MAIHWKEAVLAAFFLKMVFVVGMYFPIRITFYWKDRSEVETL